LVNLLGTCGQLQGEVLGVSELFRQLAECPWILLPLKLVECFTDALGFAGDEVFWLELVVQI
jgi:hypothetical protein